MLFYFRGDPEAPSDLCNEGHMTRKQQEFGQKESKRRRHVVHVSAALPVGQMTEHGVLQGALMTLPASFLFSSLLRISKWHWKLNPINKTQHPETSAFVVSIVTRNKKTVLKGGVFRRPVPCPLRSPGLHTRVMFAWEQTQQLHSDQLLNFRLDSREEVLSP